MAFVKIKEMLADVRNEIYMEELHYQGVIVICAGYAGR